MKRRALLFVLVAALPIAARARYRMGEENVETADPGGSAFFDSVKKNHAVATQQNASQKNEKMVLEYLSSRYSMPVDKLRYFRELHYGYEEIVPALIVAREAQVEAGKILKSRADNRTWKTIAETYSVDLKPLNKEVLDVLTPIRKALPESALKERPQTRK